MPFLYLIGDGVHNLLEAASLKACQRRVSWPARRTWRQEASKVGGANVPKDFYEFLVEI